MTSEEVIGFRKHYDELNEKLKEANALVRLMARSGVSIEIFAVRPDVPDRYDPQFPPDMEPYFAFDASIPLGWIDPKP